MLASRRRSAILSNAERLYTAAMRAHELLYEAEESGRDDGRSGVEAGGGTGTI